MRKSSVLAAVIMGIFAGVQLLAGEDEPVAYAAPQAAVSPNSMANGAYFMLLNVKRIKNQNVVSRQAVVFPVVVKTDGKTLVIGGKNAPQMTGSIRDGVVQASHVPGRSFSISGTTFNGYAASGRFSAGELGEGTFALVTVSKGGANFVGGKTPLGIGQTRTGVGSTGTFTSVLPSGTNNKQWGYDGPGLYGSSQDGLNLPNSVNGYNAKDPTLQPYGGSGSSTAPKSGSDDSGWSFTKWVSGFSLTGNSSSGQTSSGQTSSGQTSSGQTSSGQTSSGANDSSSKVKPFTDPGSASSSSSSGSTADNSGFFCQYLGVGCGGSSSSSSTSSGASSSTSSGGGGGFEAGDWAPAGGDTSPGQKPNTGNGQDHGGGSGSAGGTLRLPVGGDVDPGDFFKPAPGDVLNTNKLFNGASDPPRTSTVH